MARKRMRAGLVRLMTATTCSLPAPSKEPVVTRSAVEAVDTFDVDEINERWRQLAAVDVWAQLIMKEPVDEVERLLDTPRTGTYVLRKKGSRALSS